MADQRGARLCGADLTGANLEKTGIFREVTLRRFPDVKHSAATRWDTCEEDWLRPVNQ